MQRCWQSERKALDDAEATVRALKRWIVSTRLFLTSSEAERPIHAEAMARHERTLRIMGEWPGDVKASRAVAG